jgi:hypothetical protein
LYSVTPITDVSDDASDAGFRTLIWK